MTAVFKPPTPIDFLRLSTRLSIGLFGSIEQGKASNWQQQATDYFANDDIDIYNPRRDNWDASWEQSVTNPEFNKQVSWELSALHGVSIRLFYFEPNTLAPISLLELGLSHSLRNVVCCPSGYWRKGNIDITCQRFRICQKPTLNEALDECRTILLRL